MQSKFPSIDQAVYTNDADKSSGISGTPSMLAPAKGVILGVVLGSAAWGVTLTTVVSAFKWIVRTR